MQTRYSSSALSRQLLLQFYYIAKFFGVANCILNRKALKVIHLKRRNKLIAAILRVILITIFQGVQANLYANLILSLDGYIGIFSSLQVVSVSIFAIFSVLIQAKGEDDILNCINSFFKIYKNICEKFRTTNMFKASFTFFLAAKFVSTIYGLRHDIPTLFEASELEIHYLQRISEVIGVYMWIGSMLTLDGCFVGFLIIAELYRELEQQLSQTLAKLRQHETTNEFNASKSHYTLMQLLCEYADHIDDFAMIYSNLYKLSKAFTSIVQWQILYYIYYNFVVILLTLHKCISTYMQDDEINLYDLGQVCGKITNLTLLIMCADCATRISLAPKLLYIDLICSGIDERWDTSVESFLCQLNTQNLKLDILGFFSLNNGFILIVLSGVISYLFILIQFGLTGGS